MDCLSLDWDYVTGDWALYPGRNHCGFCQPATWGRGTKATGPSARARFSTYREHWQGVLGQLSDYTGPKPGAPVYVAECHATIMHVIHKHNVRTVYDMDTHTDDAAGGNPLCCNNWIRFALRSNCSVSSVYCEFPNEVRRPIHTDVVFVCRSSPWTPAHMDAYFWWLIRVFENKSGTRARFIGNRHEVLENEYRTFQRRQAA